MKLDSVARRCAFWLAMGPLVALVAAAQSPSPEDLRGRVRAYRLAHERQIVAELAELVSLPNVAADDPAIRRNAEWLRSSLAGRGFEARLLEVTGAPPVVLGELPTEGAKKTVVFYAHYDGQPVVPEEWSTPPWAPVLREGPPGSPGTIIELGTRDGALDGEWRLYGRSVADDKGPIVALLFALDALRSTGIPPSVNVKVFMDGEEEVGSPHVGEVLRAHRDELGGDLWVFCDGPAHQTRRPQLVFGVRGVMALQLTAYGPSVPLHSGHYGNWVPDPGMLLARLVASLRDADGNPRVKGLVDAVRDPGPTAHAAIAAMPPVEEQLRHDLALGWSEGAPSSLGESLLLPAINLLGFATGQIGDKATNAIPSRADAVLGFRLVPDLTPGRARELVEAHIRAQGFAIIGHEPSADERRSLGRLVRLEWGDGYPALWTSMDLPVSQALIRVVEEAVEGPLVLTPTLGGSLPLYVFDQVLGAPVVVLPTVNHDNNQHAADENLRLQNLWDAVEIFAAVIARLGGEWD